MMQAVVDNITGMVYWIPTDQSAAAPMPPFAPVVMQPAYRFLMPPPQVPVPVGVPVGVPVEMNTTVFVRGIPREATTQTVESHFRIYGEIVSCHVIRHKDASTNKGIAFVKFRDSAAAQRAINCNQPGVMHQREVHAEWAHPRPASSASHALPDQQIVAGPSSAPPHVYLATSASGHVMTSPSPRFLPFGGTHQPWVVGRSCLAVSPYGAPYLPAAVGGQVLGFPAHAGFSSGGENYGQEWYSSSVNYFPVSDYYRPSGYLSAAAPAEGSTSVAAGSVQNPPRYESDVATVAHPEREPETEGGHEDNGQSSIAHDRLHPADSERIGSTKSRKGKEKAI